MKWRPFIIGFFACLLLFGLLNVLAAHVRSDCGLSAILGWASCSDDIRRAGFPWLVWEEGGFAYHSYFFPEAFLADVGLALVVSLGVGWTSQQYFRNSRSS